MRDLKQQPARFDAYLGQFLNLSSQLESRFTDEQKCFLFIDGLQPETKLKIATHPSKVTTLEQAIELASLCKHATPSHSRQDVPVNFAKSQNNRNKPIHFNKYKTSNTNTGPRNQFKKADLKSSQKTNLITNQKNFEMF
jgi:hypothetical protein